MRADKPRNEGVYNGRAYPRERNGEELGSLIFPNYVPTGEDLMAMARYWLDYHIKEALHGIFHGLAVIDAFASRKVNEISALIGQEAILKIDEELIREYRDRLGEAVWEMYQNGGAVEWEMLSRVFKRIESKNQTNYCHACQQTMPCGVEGNLI